MLLYDLYNQPRSNSSHQAVSQREKKSKMVGTILDRQLHVDHNIYIVNLYGTNIIVTVTSAATSSVVENWIETAFRLRRDVYRKSTFIIGFAIDPQVNTLQFSLGDSCLIFQLARADTIPQSLRDFMKDRMIGFPGFNNKTYFQDLRSSKHALEMYISPADLTRWDRRYMYDTVDELVKNCLGFRVKLEDEVMMSDWSVENLSDEQVVYACVKTHCAFHIGRQFHVWEWWCMY